MRLNDQVINKSIVTDNFLPFFLNQISGKILLGVEGEFGGSAWEDEILLLFVKVFCYVKLSKYCLNCSNIENFLNYEKNYLSNFRKILGNFT